MPIRKTVQQGPTRIELDDKFFFFDAEPIAERMPATRPQGQWSKKQGISRGSVDKLMHIHRVDVRKPVNTAKPAFLSRTRPAPIQCLSRWFTEL
jgi:hypothetical protein